MIEVRALRVMRNKKTICSVEELRVQTGERLAVVGPNGAGKSTLLRVFAGLEPIVHGHCSVQVGIRERTYLHQSPYLFRSTVLANVGYGPRVRGKPETACHETALTWLERLGIRELASRNRQQLSGGEIRRVALARSLAFGAKLLLLDEPLADMDTDGIELVCRALTSLESTTIIITSPTSLPDDLATTEHFL